MSKTQIQIVIGLLLTLHLALIMLFAPLGLPVNDNDATAVRVGYLTIGAVLAQPALLAVWAGLAPQPLLRRLAQALALLACADLALDFALVHNRSRNEPADVLQIIASLVAFAVCLSAVWLLRARLKWRVAPPIANGLIAASAIKYG